MYKSLNSLTLPYLADDCHFVANVGRRRVRSADTREVVPPMQSRFSDISFNVAGPELWNNLQAQLHQPDVKLGQFKQRLRHFCFVAAALCDCCCFQICIDRYPSLEYQYIVAA